MRRAGWSFLLVTSLMSLALATGATAATPRRLPLTARVLRPGDFPSFTPETPLSFKTPKAYVAVGSGMTARERKTWASRLTREGFKRDLTEFLEGPEGPRTGLSGVMQLGSAASARAELGAELLASGAQTTFRVKRIPGAVGFGFASPHGGENILFTDGPFLYVLGYAWQGRVQNPTRSSLVDAATRLYKRVRGHPAR